MVPSERARLRRPGSEEGETLRGDLNSCCLVRGRKPGGVGTNREAGEVVMLGQGMARLGLEGKRLTESPERNLQGPMGHKEEEGEGGPGSSLCTQGPGPSPGTRWA